MEGSLNSTDACWIMISTHNSWWPHPLDHVVCGDCQDAAECGPGLVCTVCSMTRQLGPDSQHLSCAPCFVPLCPCATFMLLSLISVLCPFVRRDTHLICL